MGTQFRQIRHPRHPERHRLFRQPEGRRRPPPHTVTRTIRNILLILTWISGAFTAIGGPILIYLKPDNFWMSITSIFITFALFIAFAIIDLRMPGSPWGYWSATDTADTSDASDDAEPGIQIKPGLDLSSGTIQPAVFVGNNNIGFGPNPTLKL